MPGFDPATDEKSDSSSAKVLIANIAVTRPVKTTAESDRFTMGNPLMLRWHEPQVSEREPMEFGFLAQAAPQGGENSAQARREA